MRGKGAIPDPPRCRAYVPLRMGARRLGVGGPLPSEASLVDASPGVLDQTITSSCVAHAHVVAAFATLRRRGEGIVLGDPGALYRLSLAVQRADSGLDSTTPLRDEGLAPNECVRAIGEFGLTPWISAIDPAHAADEPGLLELEAASVARLTGAYACQSLDDAAQALAAGIAVTFAMQADAAFEDMGTGGLVGPQQGLSKGGHAMCVLGYETTLDGRVWTVQNSWGTSWGDAGFVRFSEAGAGRWFDMVACNFARVT